MAARSLGRFRFPRQVAAVRAQPMRQPQPAEHCVHDHVVEFVRGGYRVSLTPLHFRPGPAQRVASANTEKRSKP
jgi:hypothetical protein